MTMRAFLFAVLFKLKKSLSKIYAVDTISPIDENIACTYCRSLNNLVEARSSILYCFKKFETVKLHKKHHQRSPLKQIKLLRKKCHQNFYKGA